MRPTPYIAVLALFLTTGCPSTVRLELPAHPAIDLPTNQVAVIAAERKCRSTADALARQLDSLGGFVVDPTANVRLHVKQCGQTTGTTVRITEEVDPEQHIEVSRRRMAAAGRAWARVDVQVDDHIRARVSGAGVHVVHGVGDAPLMEVLSLRKSMTRHLQDSLSVDLVRQISPSPQVVRRRVYPHAHPGSPREVHTRAVLAEVAGDIWQAWDLAYRAYKEQPTSERVAYLHELHRRVGLLHERE